MVGAGRSADVYAYGDNRVLRRYRQPRDTESEVAAMEHARSRGFPAPAAEAVSPTDIVMDRIEGRTMLAEMLQRPWLLPRYAAMLATLHDRLHAIDGPDWLEAPLGEGGSLLHLDLHPDNVILSPAGPVVIDWPNAARGPSRAEIAHTWIVLACSIPPTGIYRRAASVAGRRLFLSLFLRRWQRAEVASHLEAAGSYRLGNRNLPPAEIKAVSALLRRRDASAS